MHFCRAGSEKPVADFDWSLWKHGSEKLHKSIGAWALSRVCLADRLHQID